VSLVPLLKRSGPLSRAALYWHYPHYSNQGGKPGGAVRRGDDKLIEFYEDGRLELYDLRNDPGEKNDLAAKRPEKARELHALLRAWQKSVDAQMPTPNPDYRPAQRRPAVPGKSPPWPTGAGLPATVAEQFGALIPCTRSCCAVDRGIPPPRRGERPTLVGTT
jgi:Domain of unknown function (DUF4976)